MNKTEFLSIIEPKLKTAYGTQGLFCGEQRTEQIKVWYEALKEHDHHRVEDAIGKYIKNNRFKPNPADIIALIPTKKYDGSDFNPNPVYVGKTRIFKCMKCLDSGMFTWDDEFGNTFGRPCECSAGHYYFTEAWEKLYGKNDN